MSGLPLKQTFVSTVSMSAWGQQRTHAAQQIPGLAIMRLASR
jgi:hypothetical protein